MTVANIYTIIAHPAKEARINHRPVTGNPATFTFEVKDLTGDPYNITGLGFLIRVHSQFANTTKDYWGSVIDGPNGQLQVIVGKGELIDPEGYDVELRAEYDPEGMLPVTTLARGKWLPRVSAGNREYGSRRHGTSGAGTGSNDTGGVKLETTFLELFDTPSTYAGAVDVKYLQINDARDGLEFTGPVQPDLSNSSFLELIDTPDAYTAFGTYLLAVTVGEDGIEFVPRAAGDVQNFTDLLDTPSDYVGHANKIVSVNGSENGLEFTDPAAYLTPPGGTVENAIQTRSADGLSFVGNDLTLSSQITPVANFDAGILDFYVNDTTGGSSNIIQAGVVGFDASSSEFAMYAVTGAGLRIRGDTVAIETLNILEGEIVVMGPDHVLIGQAPSTPAVLDKVTYSTPIVEILVDPLFVDVQTNLILTKDTTAGSAEFTIRIPYLVEDRSENFTLTVELLVNGSPSGISQDFLHVSGTGTSLITVTGEIVNAYSIGDEFDLRFSRTNGHNLLQAFTPTTTAPIEFSVLHYGEIGGGGGSGDVVGPVLSTDHAIVRFDGATGKLIQNSTVTMDDSGDINMGGAKILMGGGNVLTSGGTVFTSADNLSGIRSSGNGLVDAVIAGIDRTRFHNTGLQVAIGHSTSTTFLSVGDVRSGSGAVDFRLISTSAHNSTYSFAIQRASGSAGNTLFTHKGTGQFLFRTEDASDIVFLTNLQNRFVISSGGQIDVFGPIFMNGNTLSMENGNITMGSGTVDGRNVSVDGAKLDTIESGATGDMTGAEIKALYEVEANAFTDAQFTKLAGIEDGATGDQTGAEIKALYQVEPNAFTDAQFTKLAGIEAGATGDQTGAEIKALYEAEPNAFTDAQFTKLAGIEALADVTDEANVVASLSGATLPNIGTPAADDKVLIQDTSDGNNLKYADASTLGGGGGVTTFLGLTDTPADYTGQALNVVRVNAAADALEFATISVGAGDVVGPASAIDSNFASFDTTTGKLIKDSTFSSSSFATAAQGTLADSALQPGDIGSSVGDVVGPASATDTALARFDGTTGKLIQNSSVTVDDTGTLVSAGLNVFGNTIRTGFGATTGDNALLLGFDRTGNGNTYIDLFSAAGGVYGLRIIKNAGVNSAASITSSGTGNLHLSTENAAGDLHLGAGNASRIVIDGGTGDAVFQEQTKIQVNQSQLTGNEYEAIRLHHTAAVDNVIMKITSGDYTLAERAYIAFNQNSGTNFISEITFGVSAGVAPYDVLGLRWDGIEAYTSVKMLGEFLYFSSTNNIGMQAPTTGALGISIDGAVRHEWTSTTYSLGKNLDTHVVGLDMGQGRTGDGLTYIDLIGDTTYTDYGMRLIRFGGAAGQSHILHNGVGDLAILTAHASNITIWTNNSRRMLITGTGVIEIEAPVGMNANAITMELGRLAFGTSSLSSFFHMETANDIVYYYAGGNLSKTWAPTYTIEALPIFLGGGSFLSMDYTTIAVPAEANRAKYYVDNGGAGGKLRAMVQFPTGAAQVVASEP